MQTTKAFDLYKISKVLEYGYENSEPQKELSQYEVFEILKKEAKRDDIDFGHLTTIAKFLNSANGKTTKICSGVFILYVPQFKEVNNIDKLTINAKILYYKTL